MEGGQLGHLWLGPCLDNRINGDLKEIENLLQQLFLNRYLPKRRSIKPSVAVVSVTMVCCRLDTTLYWVGATNVGVEPVQLLLELICNLVLCVLQEQSSFLNYGPIPWHSLNKPCPTYATTLLNMLPCIHVIMDCLDARIDNIYVSGICQLKLARV